MSDSESFAAAAHLHVLLRRKTGRVTDTEWLATNADYARAMVQFVREHSSVDGHEELLRLALKLEALIPKMGLVARRPLLQVASEALRASQAPAVRPAAAPGVRHSAFADSVPASGFRESRLNSTLGSERRDGPDVPRYVGGIR